MITAKDTAAIRDLSQALEGLLTAIEGAQFREEGAIAEAVRDADSALTPVYAWLLNLPSSPPGIAATTDELAAAFRLWEQRYLADPAGFAPEPAPDYGSACARYVLELLAEVRASKPVACPPTPVR